MQKKYNVRNTTKAARIELSRSNGRLMCVFPFNDYARGGRVKACSPVTHLKAFLSHDTNPVVLVRFGKTWWKLQAQAFQFAEDNKPMRLSSGRVSKAWLVFRATELVMVAYTPCELTPW